MGTGRAERPRGVWIWTGPAGAAMEEVIEELIDVPQRVAGLGKVPRAAVDIAHHRAGQWTISIWIRRSDLRQAAQAVVHEAGDATQFVRNAGDLAGQVVCGAGNAV